MDMKINIVLPTSSIATNDASMVLRIFLDLS